MANPFDDLGHWLTGTNPQGQQQQPGQTPDLAARGVRFGPGGPPGGGAPLSSMQRGQATTTAPPRGLQPRPWGEDMPMPPSGQMARNEGGDFVRSLNNGSRLETFVNSLDQVNRNQLRTDAGRAEIRKGLWDAYTDEEIRNRGGSQLEARLQTLNTEAGIEGGLIDRRANAAQRLMMTDYGGRAGLMGIQAGTARSLSDGMTDRALIHATPQQTMAEGYRNYMTSAGNTLERYAPNGFLKFTEGLSNLLGPLGSLAAVASIAGGR